MVLGALNVKMHVETMEIVTDRGPQFIDITPDVVAATVRSGIRNGLVVVFSKHTTAAIKINENEPELIKDMEHLVSHVAPADQYYHHNNFDVRTVNMVEDECPNGHSHCQHLLLNTSETIPLLDGKLQLGTWQSIFLVELERSRPRQVLVQILGI
ncbi:MAG: YjbQ family protein [Chloroflexi bacterium]|nr:YjbQ family protein [Chloroflexota bacterium]